MYQSENLQKMTLGTSSFGSMLPRIINFFIMTSLWNMKKTTVALIGLVSVDGKNQKAEYYVTNGSRIRMKIKRRQWKDECFDPKRWDTQ
ncbi:MAG: hypothetical protein K2N63_13645 [Lachnospiraceae bacterium]|nr:hypothetical protein [Lachnospiraceae bacterium]